MSPNEIQFRDIERCRLCGALITMLEKHWISRELEILGDRPDIIVNDDILDLHICQVCLTRVLSDIMRHEEWQEFWK